MMQSNHITDRAAVGFFEFFIGGLMLGMPLLSL